MTKQLVQQGLLQCDGTDIKMPGMVIEVAKMPSGQTVVVVGDVSGFAYHKKDLPLNGILPETLAPTAAIATGILLGVLGAYLEGTGHLPALRRKVRRTFSGFLKAQTAEAASDMGMADEYYEGGSFLKEMGLLVFGALLFGLAFIVADRLALQPELIILYLIMGGIAIVIHEFGHRMVAGKIGIAGEFKFWGLGSFTLLLTSLLFGMAFAQPGRYVFYGSDEADDRDVALVTLAGPAVSVLFAIVFLPFALIGGVAGQIAVAGFTMNLMTAVYNLLPFSPMDGKVIYGWSKTFWMVMFVPLALFFVLMTLLFV
jgi:Zn-dependent protease